jgi:hypothetical protein
MLKDIFDQRKVGYIKYMIIILYPIPNKIYSRCWWLMPVILATQEAEIRRIVVQS